MTREQIISYQREILTLPFDEQITRARADNMEEHFAVFFANTLMAIHPDGYKTNRP